MPGILDPTAAAKDGSNPLPASLVKDPAALDSPSGLGAVAIAAGVASGSHEYASGLSPAATASARRFGSRIGISETWL